MKENLHFVIVLVITVLGRLPSFFRLLFLPNRIIPQDSPRSAFCLRNTYCCYKAHPVSWSDQNATRRRRVCLSLPFLIHKCMYTEY